MIRIKRVYAPVAADDGARVLIDGLWPRGLAKEAAAIDVWLKEIAPSRELRQWFGHDPGRWRVFCARYRRELKTPERSAALARLRAIERQAGTLTLLFAAKEETYNHARLLREML